MIHHLTRVQIQLDQWPARVPHAQHISNNHTTVYFSLQVTGGGSWGGAKAPAIDSPFLVQFPAPPRTNIAQLAACSYSDNTNIWKKNRTKNAIVEFTPHVDRIIPDLHTSLLTQQLSVHSACYCQYTVLSFKHTHKPII